MSHKPPKGRQQEPPNPPPPPPKQPVVYPSGYQRNKVPSWHLLYEDFLLAMVRNMEKGEVIDGPGNPPNYLKATPEEDKYTDDHLRNHLSDLLRGINVEANAVAIACNAMIRYQCIQHRKAQCK